MYRTSPFVTNAASCLAMLYFEQAMLLVRVSQT